ncbi:MAG: hypothetical protein LBR26_14860 [Prevotella sp.]|nr:hypothetical protein [Prevotella sp.]
MKDSKKGNGQQKNKEKETGKTKPSEEADSPYIKLAIALEKLCADDFSAEDTDV